MDIQETKQGIKDYFVEIKEDKFTRVKTILCKHKITWYKTELRDEFMLTQGSYNDELKMKIEYRHKDEIDSVFFIFTYSNTEGGFPGMKNIKMYLILDDDKNIELSDSSGFEHASQSKKVGDNYYTFYVETAQLAVSMTDFIAIANANKIEYSIRFGKGSFDNIFSKNAMQIFKGFYNGSFDNEFELELLSNLINKITTNNKIIEETARKDMKDGERLAFSIFASLIAIWVLYNLLSIYLSESLKEHGVILGEFETPCFLGISLLGGYLAYFVVNKIF